jgi:hypothetical protein
MQALTLMVVYVMTTFAVQFIGFLISRLVDYEWPTRLDDLPDTVHGRVRNCVADCRPHCRMDDRPRWICCSNTAKWRRSAQGCWA